MTLAHKTGLIALSVALMATALLMPPRAASAADAVDEAAFALAGTMHLSDGFGSTSGEPGCIGGTAIGGGTGANDRAVVPNASIPNVGASFTYSTTGITTGSASGNLWIDGLELDSGNQVDVNADFDLSWVGAIVLVELKGNNEHGVAVASLVPVEAQLFSCGGNKKDNNSISHGFWPFEEHAQIVGVGVITIECEPGEILEQVLGPSPC